MNDLFTQVSLGLAVAFGTFIGCFFFMGMFLGALRTLGIYCIVEERRSLVFVLFGKVELVISEPGLFFPFLDIGWKALVINTLGSVTEVDLRLDQDYLRSLPVNSEEGAPMGIGIWYETQISDPVNYLFKNADPRGSLRANVGNSTVRNLSNMKLAAMLGERHQMSMLVREDIRGKAQEWGYAIGSIYIRKVHFRDEAMIQQIEEKVVNRLRQVTSAIRQDGTNQVNLITSKAERQAAIEFAQAAARRPYIVGSALHTIAQDKEVSEAMFEILENQKMLEGKVNVTLIPQGTRGDLLTQYLSAQNEKNSGVGSSEKPTSPLEKQNVSGAPPLPLTPT